MNGDRLADALIQKAFGWEPRRDRFMTGDGRNWVNRTTFQPTKSLDAAFRLLDAVKPIDFRLGRTGTGPCTARVTLKGASGEATSQSMPLAVCVALARALGISVEVLD